MQKQFKSLTRLLSLTQQRSRLADAACLAARKRWNTAIARRDRLEQRAVEVSRQFEELVGSPHARDRFASCHALMQELREKITTAVEQVAVEEMRFDEAAATCTSLRREIDVLENLISQKEAERRRERSRLEDARNDERVLQQRHLRAVRGEAAAHGGRESKGVAGERRILTRTQ